MSMFTIFYEFKLTDQFLDWFITDVQGLSFNNPQFEREKYTGN